MPRENPVVRLNIYVPDPSIRRRVKAAAAREDMSVSEYCVRAIIAQLEREPTDRPGSGSTAAPVVREAVDRARSFRARVFSDRAFSVSSAELISEARERR
jgi:hypothetical protein